MAYPRILLDLVACKLNPMDNNPDKLLWLAALCYCLPWLVLACLYYHLLLALLVRAGICSSRMTRLRVAQSPCRPQWLLNSCVDRCCFTGSAVSHFANRAPIGLDRLYYAGTHASCSNSRKDTSGEQAGGRTGATRARRFSPATNRMAGLFRFGAPIVSSCLPWSCTCSCTANDWVNCLLATPG